MFLDKIHGIIERRILLNYRIDPEVLQAFLPSQFRLKLYNGYGIGGICMIRFREIRPQLIPAWMGVSSENAAHRIAVEWDQDGVTKEGVYIPRRDTNSGFNSMLGGKVFPGIFNRSQFISEDEGDSYKLKIVRHDGSEQVRFAGRISDQLPTTSVFPSLQHASDFFTLGSTGYSATHAEDRYHGMELHCLEWNIVPMEIEEAYSYFYDDQTKFPEGTATLDSALIMRNIAHEWHSRPNLQTASSGTGFSCC